MASLRQAGAKLRSFTHCLNKVVPAALRVLCTGVNNDEPTRSAVLHLSGWQGRRLHSTESSAKKTVAVAMSGGVDSAVAALLIKGQGHDVFGVFMRNWDEAEEQGNQNCSMEADFRDAQRVCEHLRIPLRTADFASLYWNRVFTDFVAKCERGLTPNPDLACNRHIKFDALLDFARFQGADMLATGHYARLKQLETGGLQLLKGVDVDKDQSYFLASVKGAAFRNVLFPLGHLLKSQVRAIASDAGIHVADRRSSAGICFIGRRKFGDFLAQYTAAMPGVYIDADTDRQLGICHNLAGVTYGQRAPIGGNARKMFVVGKDIPGRRVYVGMGQDHPGLFPHSAMLRTPHWVAGTPPPGLAEHGICRCSFKARYRQEARSCVVAAEGGRGDVSKFTRLLDQDYPASDSETLQVSFDPWTAKCITPQQEFVLYDGDNCLGSAPVAYPGRTHAEPLELHEHSQIPATL